MIRIASRLRAARASRRAVTSVEFALAATFVLAPLCAGASDLGVIVVTWSRVNSVQSAVVTYAWANPTASSSSLTSVASTVWNTASPSLTAAATRACYCIAPTGTRQSGTVESCSGSCSGSQVLANYMTISLSTSVTLVVPLPGLSSPFQIATTTTVRVL